ncbi:MAG: tRNA epoxyqueuosine(34) reductase QueG [Phycisphaerales bacterium]
MPPEPLQLTEDILALCRDLGFVAAGIADAAPTRHRDHFLAWLGSGKHGSMAYFAEQVEARLDPTKLLPDARAAIMVADLYATRNESEDPPLPPGHGRIARYARGRDYHPVLKKRLHTLADALRARYPDAGFRAFVDTAPILEREYAARAGLGWIGKHTLLIHPQLGSYLLLGGLLTTLDLQPPPDQEVITDHCGTCTRCIDACPTQAISSGGAEPGGTGVPPVRSIDASRCISYLTIERRAPIPPEFHQPIGPRLYGCDICQEVCPHNSPRPAPASRPDGAEGCSHGWSDAQLRATRGNVAREQLRPGRGGGGVHPDYTPQNSSFNLLQVLNWTPEDRARAFQGRALKRATLGMMKRNALIALGNDPALRTQPQVLARLDQAAADPAEPPLVRDTAAAVLTQLRAAQI